MADAMEVVRDLFRALNAGDVEAAAAFYHSDCQTEHLFAAENEFCAGRDNIRRGWSQDFAAYAGGLPGNHRFEVGQIAGIETGWGWVRAEWVSVARSRRSDELRASAGYSYFWVEDGLIKKHRNVAREVPVQSLRAARPQSERRYPTRPLVGIGAVVIDGQRVLLVKRKHEPLARQWSLPGGMLELGESLEAGVTREIAEETGLHVDVGPVVEVFDRILLDDKGKVRYHFVLVDYICTVRGGELVAGSDVSDVAWADALDLDRFHLAAKPRSVIERAFGRRPAL